MTTQAAAKQHRSTAKPYLTEFNGANFVVEYRDVLSGDRAVYIIPCFQTNR